MGARPVLLLDVDGVLNRLKDLADKEGFDDFDTAICNGRFTIRYSRRMGERLAALEADIVWLTTWENDANEWIGPLFGWPELPFIERGGHDARNRWWKSSAAELYLAEHPRSLIWIDDDLAEGMGFAPWLSTYEPGRLLIAPYPTRGLLPRHLEQVEAWIARR